MSRCACTCISLSAGEGDGVITIDWSKSCLLFKSENWTFLTIMSHFEEHIVERWSGARITIGSLVLGLSGILPLLLYIEFGPHNGNPIGLGLLATLTVPLAGIGMVAGTIKTVVQHVGQGAE